MPAKKPVDLITRAETKSIRRHRRSQLERMTPKKTLSVRPPRELTGPVEREIWAQTVRTYMELDARIVSTLDQGLLMDYCVACQQRQEIDDMRTAALSNYLKSEAILQKVELGKQEVEAKVLLKLFSAVARDADRMLKLDARADQKRKLIHTLRQGLMLTPRSRGGVNPNEKMPEIPPSEIERIIDGTANPETSPKGGGNV
jgi:hypothetical protein